MALGAKVGTTVVAERKADRERTIVAAKIFFVSILVVALEGIGVTAGLFILQSGSLSETLLLTALFQLFVAGGMVLLAYGASLHWRRCIKSFFLVLFLLSGLISYTSSKLVPLAKIYFHGWHFALEVIACLAYYNYVQKLYNTLEWGMSTEKLYETMAQPCVEDAIQELKCQYVHRVEFDEEEMEEIEEPKPDAGRPARIPFRGRFAKTEKKTAPEAKMPDMDTQLRAALKSQAPEREMRVMTWASSLDSKTTGNLTEVSYLSSYEITPNGPMETAIIRPNWGVEN